MLMDAKSGGSKANGQLSVCSCDRLECSANDLRAIGKPLCRLITFGRSKVEIGRINPSFACSVARA